MSSMIGCNNASKHLDVHLLHAWVGHCSWSKLRHIDACKTHCDEPFHSDTCMIPKCHRLPFARSVSMAQKPFDLVHMDIWGPYRVPDVRRAHYFLTILDDCTQTTWTFLMPGKSHKLLNMSNISMLS